MVHPMIPTNSRLLGLPVPSKNFRLVDMLVSPCLPSWKARKSGGLRPPLPVFMLEMLFQDLMFWSTLFEGFAGVSRSRAEVGEDVESHGPAEEEDIRYLI